MSERIALYAGEHGKHCLRRVQRDGGKSAHIQVELLIQEFQQGAVDAQVVGVDIYGVHGRSHAFLGYGDGIEE